MGPTGPGVPPFRPPVSPSPADCMGVAGCTPFFPSARKKCVVSTCLLPALGLTALGGLQGFYPSRILSLHTSASWKSDALVYTSGGGDRSIVGGARLGKGRREMSLSVSRLSPSPQPLAGGPPALKHLSQGWLPSPCPSSETPEGGPYLGCGEKPGTSGVSAETSLLCPQCASCQRSPLSPISSALCAPHPPPSPFILWMPHP